MESLEYTPGMKDSTIRRLTDQDSIADLTKLVRTAYQKLADMGLRYWGTHQSEDDTRKRISKGETWVCEHETRLIGTATVLGPSETGGSPWYDRPDVAKGNQFAVHPDFQGLGIGMMLLAKAEERAKELGAKELAFDTSEDAHHLIEMYGKLGYRFIENIDWRPDVNYLSIVMSKTL